MNSYKKPTIVTENVLEIIGPAQNAYTGQISVETWRGSAKLDSNKTAEIKMASLNSSEKIYTARV